MKKSVRALSKGINIGSALVSRSPKASVSAIPGDILVSPTDKQLYLGKLLMVNEYC